jgi:competence protein ComEA
VSAKATGIATAIGGLTIIGIGAFILWYRAEDFPSDVPPTGEMLTDSVLVAAPTPLLDAPADVPTASGAQVARAPGRLMVEIQGAVAVPGVYGLPPEARVHDALEKAGGAIENAEIRDINIAAALVDGSVLTIPYQQNEEGPLQPGAADLNPPGYTRSGWAETTTASAAPASGVSATSVPGKVNINTATQAELETLPGVGEKTAEKIIRHRETQRFTQVDDLGYVQGIGEKRLETLRPHVTVE